MDLCHRGFYLQVWNYVDGNVIYYDIISVQKDGDAADDIEDTVTQEEEVQNANINAYIKFSPKPKIFAWTQNFCPNQNFWPKPKIFTQT